MDGESRKRKRKEEAEEGKGKTENIGKRRLQQIVSTGTVVGLRTLENNKRVELSVSAQELFDLGEVLLQEDVPLARDCFRKVTYNSHTTTHSTQHTHPMDRSPRSPL
jgi:hypothetical protein